MMEGRPPDPREDRACLGPFAPARHAGLLIAAVALWAAACGDSGAPGDESATAAATEPGGPSVATGTATATGTAVPTPTPVVATVTVPVAAGQQTERLLLTEGSALVVQEIDGSRRVIARFEDDSLSPGFPTWSPDGETVAFVARSFFRGDPEAEWGDEVYLVAADGGEPELVRPRRITGEQVFGLAWLPDGDGLLLGRIELELRDGVPTNIAGAAVASFDLASGDERVIVDGAYDPSLSADGTRMAYVELGALSTDVSIVAANVDGSDPVLIAAPGRFELTRFPRISPDGETVAFTAAAPLVRAPDGEGGRLGEVARRAAGAAGTSAGGGGLEGCAGSRARYPDGHLAGGLAHGRRDATDGDRRGRSIPRLVLGRWDGAVHRDGRAVRGDGGGR